MENAELRKQVLARWNALKGERSSWDSHWREISNVLLPRSGRFLSCDNNKGGKRHKDIIDNSGTRALRTLAGGMMAGMTSPARPWFRLTTLNPELDESYEVKVWMSEVTSLMQMVFNRTNVYRALHTAYEELGAFGTSATIVLDDWRKVIHCLPLTIGEYCIAADARGTVDTLYREFRITVGGLVKEFGYDNCSAFVRSAWDDHRLDEWVTVVNAIEPRLERDPSKLDALNMPYRSVYFELQDGNRILRESGFRIFPALVGRWGVTGGDIYGTSPGMEALGDLNQLQQEQLRKSQAIDYQSNPPILVPADMKDEESAIIPGGTLYVGSTAQAQMVRTAFDVPLNLQYLLPDIQDIRNRINEAFYKDIFMMLTETGGNRMTATEVAERHEEKMLMLGPVIDRLNNEMLDPLIKLVFDRLLEQNMIPPVPDALQGQEMNVEYTSILAQSQKAVTTNAIDRFTNNLGVLMNMKQDVADNFDFDYWAQHYADSLGLDPRLIVPSKTVMAIRQQRAQAAQAQAQMEMAQQAAGAMKDMSAALGNGLDTGMTTPDNSQIGGMFTGY